MLDWPLSSVDATNIIFFLDHLHRWIAIHHLAVVRLVHWHLRVTTLHKWVVVKAHITHSAEVLAWKTHLLWHKSICT